MTNSCCLQYLTGIFPMPEYFKLFKINWKSQTWISSQILLVWVWFFKDLNGLTQWLLCRHFWQINTFKLVQGGRELETGNYLWIWLVLFFKWDKLDMSCLCTWYKRLSPCNDCAISSWGTEAGSDLLSQPHVPMRKSKSKQRECITINFHEHLKPFRHSHQSSRLFHNPLGCFNSKCCKMLQLI